MNTDVNDTGMNPEAAEAIRIADKHLAGETKERRLALALDIQAAIISHAGAIAMAAIRDGFERARKAEGRNA